MRFDLKKLFCVLAILGFAYAFTCFSYEADTWYTDFYLGSNTALVVSGGQQESLDFYLKNNSDSAISGRFIAVDAVEVQTGVFVCLTEGQSGSVGQYITIEPSTFSLSPFSTFTGMLTVNFPNAYAGKYVGCLVYIPNGSEETESINTIPRKALLINAMLNATAVRYQVKVFPGSRSKPSLANVGEIRFYKGNSCIYSGIIVQTDASGFATFDASIWEDTYTVVYKGQSHLASYLTDVHVGSGYSTGFDFTTGENLVGVQNFTNSTDNGFRYQIAGDLESELGDYDFTINGNDITIVLTAGLGSSVSPLDPRDLNGDGKVSVDDLAVIGANFEQSDIFNAGNIFDGLW